MCQLIKANKYIGAIIVEDNHKRTRNEIREPLIITEIISNISRPEITGDAILSTLN